MLKRIVPHLCLAISIMMLVLFSVDRVNEAMNFIGNDTFDFLLLLFCFTAMPTSVYLIADNRRRKR